LVFLSYTYRPHPDHKADLERLRDCVVRAIEAMGLRVLDGVHLGGRSLDEIRNRIEDTDALVALVTPQADKAGQPTDPTFVLSEFQFAQGAKKPTMRVCHSLLAPRGLGAGNEYTPYMPGNEVDVILKLMNTIAVWRHDYGQRTRLRIEPESLAASYDETRGDECLFQLITAKGKFCPYKKTHLSLEPGAAYAVLPMLRDDDRIRLRLSQGGSMWQSRDTINPFVGSVTLQRQS
jgi:hypothetical protein